MKMPKLEKAILVLNAGQMPAAAGSHIADIDPRALLLMTVAYLVLMLSVPLGKPGMIIWFAVYPIVSAPLAHVSYERLFVKSLYVLPLLLLIGIFNPFYDHRTAFTVGSVAVSEGWVSFVSVLIRGLLAMQALLLLVYVAGFNRMCEAMRQLKVPRVLVTQLLMVYRYLTVMLQEALSMHRARMARGYGRSGYRASMWGPFVGQLLLRTVERARAVHRSMLARGFDGSLVVGQPSRWASADTVYCLTWGIVFILLRIFDFSALLFDKFHVCA